jgi:hypothetical protein
MYNVDGIYLIINILTFSLSIIGLLWAWRAFKHIAR